MLRKHPLSLIAGVATLSLISCSSRWADPALPYTLPPLASSPKVPLSSESGTPKQEPIVNPAPLPKTDLKSPELSQAVPPQSEPLKSDSVDPIATLPDFVLEPGLEDLGLEDQNSENAESTEPEKAPQTKVLDIRLFRSYGHEKLVHISGRLVRPEERPPVSASDSKWSNFWRNLKDLSVKEIQGVQVRFELNGRSLIVTSNEEGMLQLSSAAFGILSPGEHVLKAELLPGQEYSATSSSVAIQIHARSDTSPSLVSDIDDTLVKTQVSDKLLALQNFLLDNALSSDLIAGTSEMYQALEQNFDGKTDGDIFYLSGSPLNFSDRIYKLLDSHKYPTGSVTLKKWGFDAGDDNPLQQKNYKQKALRKLFLTYPNKPFYLFGDSGEHDPEIYREIAAEFPDQVRAIFINNVSEEQPDMERFKGVYLTRHSVDAAQILLSKGLLSAADVSRVHQALLASQKKDD